MISSRDDVSEDSLCLRQTARQAGEIGEALVSFRRDGQCTDRSLQWNVLGIIEELLYQPGQFSSISIGCTSEWSRHYHQCNRLDISDLFQYPVAVDLSIQHPAYTGMYGRWLIARDFHRGGHHVLRPSSSRGMGWLFPTSRKGESVSAVEPIIVASYLWRHERETPEEYRRRVLSAYHVPLFRPMSNILASAVLAPGARRTAGPDWSQYMADVDLCGTPISIFARDVLTAGLIYGRAHVLTDMVPGQAASVADQRERGLRAYSYLLTPIEIINWSFDSRRQLRWINVREDPPDDTRRPDERMEPPTDWHRIWTREGWSLYDAKNRLVAEGTHPLGRIPICTVWANRTGRSFAGVESPLADILDCDRSLLNKASLLDEILARQTFSTLAAPHREGAPTADIEIGVNRVLYFDAEGSAPTYLSPDAAQALALWRIIQELRQMATVASEVGRGISERSLEARSAAALAAETADRYNLLANLAESMEVLEREMYRDVATWESISTVPEISYPRRFDLRSTAQQIIDLGQLAQAKLDARALSLLAKPLAARFMAELGGDIDEVNQVRAAAEISGAIEEGQEIASGPEIAALRRGGAI